MDFGGEVQLNVAASEVARRWKSSRRSKRFIIPVLEVIWVVKGTGNGERRGDSERREGIN